MPDDPPSGPYETVAIRTDGAIAIYVIVHSVGLEAYW
jgi:hypothetical protein